MSLLSDRCDKGGVSSDVLRQACERVLAAAKDLDEAAGKEDDLLLREAKFREADNFRAICDQAVERAETICSTGSGKRLAKARVTISTFCGADRDSVLKFSDWKDLWEATIIPQTSVDGEKLGLLLAHLDDAAANHVTNCESYGAAMTTLTKYYNNKDRVVKACARLLVALVQQVPEIALCGTHIAGAKTELRGERQRLVARVVEFEPALRGAQCFPVKSERHGGRCRPPRYVRAVLWDYRFAEPAVRAETGDWWVRNEVGVYCPPIDAERWRQARR